VKASSPPRKKTFRGVFSNLANIDEFVRQAAQKAGLNDTETYQVETAVDEACSNIIEHAYGGENKGNITCCCDCAPGCITIILKDNGKRFSPDNIPEPNVHGSLEERESHGLGLFFIKKLMDEVHFDFSDPSVNVLVMTKRKG
jgi:serine/threonine-protein kinase RsbW